jgi:hypothetical protein
MNSNELKEISTLVCLVVAPSILCTYGVNISRVALCRYDNCIIHR